MVITAQTRCLRSALRLQNEMLTSTWMEDSRKLALTADCQAVCNKQESTHRPASSHAQCPRQRASPRGRKKTPQPPGSCQSSSSCLLGAFCLIMLLKGQVQYSADDKFKSNPVPKTSNSRALHFSLDSLCPEHRVCMSLRSQWDYSFAISLNSLDSLLLLLVPDDDFPLFATPFYSLHYNTIYSFSSTSTRREESLGRVEEYSIRRSSVRSYYFDK